MSMDETAAYWVSRAAALEPRASPFIDGDYVESMDDARFSSISPATGEVLCEVSCGCVSDIDRAVAAARLAFEDRRWSGLKLSRRKAILLAVADLIDEHGDELALLEALEVGKAISNAREELALSIAFFRYYAEAIDKLYGLVAPSDGSLVALSVFKPRGVVGAIVPWNFPLANAAMKVAPALAAGNTVVLKPSEIASLSALRLAELTIQAGLPAGVFNVVPGLGQTAGTAIARHQDIDFLTFTGSTATGRRLMQHAGESNGKPLMLECGGKSAQIICADMADEIEAIAPKIVRDAFWNQGQWCSARSRLIIDGSLYDRLLDAVISEASKLIPGEPLDPSANFGTIASAQQFERIEHFIDSGKNDGARLVLKGETRSPCALSMGPTIFAEVESSMTVAREEIFGPVLCAVRADGISDAIAKANDTVYGLSATVWCHDARIARTAARSIDAGRIVIRTSARNVGTASIAAAAEPCRASGFGIEKGMDGLRAYCRVQAVEIL